MVTSVCVKYSYDRLHINKALGISLKVTTTTRTTFVVIRHASGSKNELL